MEVTVLPKITDNVRILLDAARNHFGATAQVRAKDLYAFTVKNDLSFPKVWLRQVAQVSRGLFSLDAQYIERKYKGGEPVPVPMPHVTPEPDTDLVENAAVVHLHPKAPVVKFDPNAETGHIYADVPQKNPGYIPFGDFSDVADVLKSLQFFPVFITGLSGNGKTLMVEQACAKAKRPLIRIQMSSETDEDDLIGGFRLIAGETKFIKGPVIRAMELGVVLLIDEVDRADPNKIMALQGILEGTPYYMKKTGEIIYPKQGFNVIVTANTKGRGSETGLYTAAKILDDAWLERFPVTIEQDFPSQAVEKKILAKFFEVRGVQATQETTNFIECLVGWAHTVRETYKADGVEEVISTRRLVHILQTFLVFGDRMKAIKLCVSRYAEHTKTTFLELYMKIDATVNAPVPDAPVADPTHTGGTGDTYTVTMTTPIHTDKIAAIKTLRLHLNCSLLEAKRFLDASVPPVIATDMPYEQVQSLIADMNKIGEQIMAVPNMKG